MLLTTAYFPPIEYFSILAKYSVVYLEAHEKYQKQSWRNRCRILTANGPMDLNFPIVHDGATLIKDIKVDWSTPWLHKTEYAIDSAYYSSPFFEYYRDELFAILDSHPETLWELNLGIIGFFCRKIGICPQILETESFLAPAAATAEPLQHGPRVDTVSQGSLPLFARRSAAERLPGGVMGAEPSSNARCVEDQRYSIHPKMASDYVAKPYWQVFKERFGFVGNLSIMDLLFNEGPESLCYLR
ncbi:MAG: WbqC family protein [Bacteroidales bacterium]|nr:WbqC family protein [Bacteroidales bacterium]